MNTGDAKHQAGEIRRVFDNEVVSRDYMPRTTETEMLQEIPGLCDLVYELAEEVEKHEADEARLTSDLITADRRAIRQVEEILNLRGENARLRENWNRVQSDLLRVSKDVRAVEKTLELMRNEEQSNG